MSTPSKMATEKGSTPTDPIDFFMLDPDVTEQMNEFKMKNLNDRNTAMSAAIVEAARQDAEERKGERGKGDAARSGLSREQHEHYRRFLRLANSNCPMGKGKGKGRADVNPRPNGPGVYNRYGGNGTEGGKKTMANAKANEKAEVSD
jgi:hypothetical protein